jgi:hypothetical protein
MHREKKSMQRWRVTDELAAAAAAASAAAAALRSSSTKLPSCPAVQLTWCTLARNRNAEYYREVDEESDASFENGSDMNSL